MPLAHWQVLAQVFADRMLNSVVEGVVLAMFGWALLRAGGRQNSSTRFAIWFSMMVAIAALPFFANGFAGAHAVRTPFIQRFSSRSPMRLSSLSCGH